MGRYGDDVAALATSLTHTGDLDALLERVGDARVMMLGEASHGTHGYYQWRSAITRRLIADRGFSFVAVEGDDPREALFGFDRWPTWMWANEEVVDFTRWLRRHNDGLDEAVRVGFHGLDVYSLWESLREFDRTRAVRPLHTGSVEAREAQAYPSGV